MNKPDEKHILIVEDDRTLVDFLSVALGHEGFIVTIARDGESAIQSVETSRPDLVLLDMMLPQKSGYEFIKTMQGPDYADIPIVVMSGRLVDDEFRRMVLFEPNVREYLVKPLKTPMLLHKLHSLLDTESPAMKSAEEKAKKFKEDFKLERFDK